MKKSKKMKKILFIGGLYEGEIEREVETTPDIGMQTAANIYQKKLIDGFTQNNYIVKVVSLPFIKHYTKKNKVFKFNKKKDSSNVKYLPFNNLIYYRNISRARSLKKHIHFLMKNKLLDDIDFIYIYSAHTPFLKVIKKIKKRHPKIKIVLNILDLPFYMKSESNKKLLYKVFKGLDNKVFLKNLKYVDKYVVITSNIVKELKLPIEESLVIEGISSDYLEYNKIKNKKTIVYAGGLSKEYGVDLLISEFLSLKNKSITLVLAGSGNMEQKIVEISKQHKNIVFKGKLKLKDVFELYKDAFLLVNPRPKGEFTKFSFPSKTIEYLAHGRPTISCDLEGIPKEYDDYLIYFNNHKKGDLAAKINEVIEADVDKLNEIGKRNNKFINDSKNSVKVTKKIIEFINK